MTLHDAAKTAREIADTCTAPSCHAVANALEGADRAEEDRLLLAALTEQGPVDDLPPWSAVSQPGTFEQLR
jgi:hypothetical protein